MRHALLRAAFRYRQQQEHLGQAQGRRRGTLQRVLCAGGRPYSAAVRLRPPAVAPREVASGAQGQGGVGL
jgi:hypothetical protein